jgi:hypothetical protein
MYGAMTYEHVVKSNPADLCIGIGQLHRLQHIQSVVCTTHASNLSEKPETASSELG